MHTVFSRSFDLQKVEQVQKSRPVTEQHQFAKDLQHFAALHQAQVQAGNNSSKGNSIRQDESNSNPQKKPKYRRHHKPNSKTEESQPEAGAEQIGHIDIKI
jgi:hypothetical protein